jgi:hypothetical protein
MRFRDRPADLRRLRPRRSLFWQALAGTVAFLAPTSGVLYFLTIPDGPWPLVVMLQVLVIAGFVAAYLSYVNVGVWVGTSGIAERGFFGLSKYIPREQIGSIVLVNTYRPGATAVAQLFICDENGVQVMRMRGQFWSRESMQTVSDTLDIPPMELTDELTRTELLEDHPGLLYWFERHPVIVVIAVVGALLVGGLLALIVSVLATAATT